MHSEISCISVGARASKLSIKQVEEIEFAIRYHYPNLRFKLSVCQTKGDLDQKSSLKNLDKTDFFTYELDQWLIKKKCRIAIHSAKDLPDPLDQSLEIVAITEPINSEDVIVFHPAQDLSKLPQNLTIATSSFNREKNALLKFPKAKIVDLRGTIEKRIQKVLDKEVDGVIVAKVALMRLGLGNLNMLTLKGKTTPMQGSLAILARKEDTKMKEVFSAIDSRIGEKSLYLGLNSKKYYSRGKVVHLPLIEIERCEIKDMISFINWVEKSTHLIITSQTTVEIFLNLLDFYPILKEKLHKKKIIAVGQNTAFALNKKKLYSSYIANQESQEGLIALLERMTFNADDFILYPKSEKARPNLLAYLEARQIEYKAPTLYRPKSIYLKEKPNLQDFDEIVFTSLSVVKSFFENYSELPSHLRIVCKGEATLNYLKSQLISY